jgi:hypothetical protein
MGADSADASFGASERFPTPSSYYTGNPHSSGIYECGSECHNECSKYHGRKFDSRNKLFLFGHRTEHLL